MIPLVLVHGFMGGAAQWDGVIDALKGARPVVAVDLPGFGAQNYLPPIGTISGYAAWVITEVRRLGITRYHLMGHSMGGMIVQDMVRQDQDNIANLILYSTGPAGGLPGRVESIETSKARAIADGPQATARRIAATWFLERENAPAYEACAAIAQRSSPAAIAAGLDAMQGWSGEAFLPQITRPTRIIWGDQDRTYAWAQAQQLWQTIPGAELSVLPGCAHAVHLEKPGLFNAILSDFLKNAD
ncbi:MAG: alpha/beta fold hydrolase [Sulfitobacter sp.]